MRQTNDSQILYTSKSWEKLPLCKPIFTYGKMNTNIGTPCKAFHRSFLLSFVCPGVNVKINYDYDLCCSLPTTTLVWHATFYDLAGAQKVVTCSLFQYIGLNFEYKVKSQSKTDCFNNISMLIIFLQYLSKHLKKKIVYLMHQY